MNASVTSMDGERSGSEHRHQGELAVLCLGGPPCRVSLERWKGRMLSAATPRNADILLHQPSSRLFG